MISATFWESNINISQICAGLCCIKQVLILHTDKKYSICISVHLKFSMASHTFTIYSPVSFIIEVQCSAPTSWNIYIWPRHSETIAEIHSKYNVYIPCWYWLPLSKTLRGSTRRPSFDICHDWEYWGRKTYSSASGSRVDVLLNIWKSMSIPIDNYMYSLYTAQRMMTLSMSQHTRIISEIMFSFVILQWQSLNRMHGTILTNKTSAGRFSFNVSDIFVKKFRK